MPSSAFRIHLVAVTVASAAVLATPRLAASQPAPSSPTPLPPSSTSTSTSPSRSSATSPLPSSTLSPVVVTATRSEARAFDVPASIDRIGAEEIRFGRAQVNLSESVGAVPGLVARDRQNYAQDVQISVRGFGTRSTFGIRGVRLYVDGIPATLPDGQGQITNVELGSVERIEVLRGPFSALYGNSSGGVIQVFTEEGAEPGRVTFGAGGGSDGLARGSVLASGRAGALGYTVGASRFRTDGWRQHSAAERDLGNAKLTLEPASGTTVSLVANSLALTRADDPLGLSRAQLESDPRGVDPSALAFDTRKTVNQTQTGVTVQRRVDDVHSWQLAAYLGHRGTEQYQAIPVATQANPLHPGGVIVLGRDYHGVDLRWTARLGGRERPLVVVAGVAYDDLLEHRQGYQNFVGTTLGVRGALRRDENNDVANVDEYVQASWQVAPRWSLVAGVRRSDVRFRSSDAFVTASNPDDSGSAAYGATLPVAGVTFAPSDQWRFYATAGRGFETPTLNELAYRSSGLTGLNLGLRAARSTSVELGVKARPAGLGDAALAVFETRTENEIVTQSNVGGRATFQNAGATRRRGVEASWSASAFGHARVQLAATALSAVYREGFQTCTATPCATPNQSIAAGNRLPGVAARTLYAAVRWAPPSGFYGGLEARASSRVFVNDLNSDAAPGYAIASATAGWAADAGAWRLDGFARIDNALGRRYVGSVIVNEGNARFFEPAPGRTWLVGASASYRF